MLFTLFRKAGATGHVFLLSRGNRVDKGLAYSGIVGPMTTVAVVPTTAQTINFAIQAITQDKQDVTVSGSLAVSLIPVAAVVKFDFTVNPQNGAFVNPWQQELQAKALERVLRAVLDTIKNIKVADATSSQKAVEEAVVKEFGSETNANTGFSVDACSIPTIEPDNGEVAAAVGAKERQEMLAAADKALHDRRMNAAQNERTLKEFDAATKLELEKKRAALLEEENKNKEAEANGDAAATKIRLEPLSGIEPGKLLGAALMKLADGSQRIGVVNIGPELFTAMGQKAA